MASRVWGSRGPRLQAGLQCCQHGRALPRSKIRQRVAARAHASQLAQPALPQRQKHARRKVICHEAAGGALAQSAAAEEPHGATFSQAVVSVCNVVMGVGLLSVPVALSKSGYGGILILWLLGLICCHTGKALCRCAETVVEQGAAANEEMVRYEDIAKAAFGKIGQSIVAGMMYTELVGTCALLVILESDNLWNLLSPTVVERGADALGVAAPVLGGPVRVFWFAAAVLGATVLAPNVKALSKLGIFGFLATLTVSVSVALVLFTGAHTFSTFLCMHMWIAIALALFAGTRTICPLLSAIAEGAFTGGATTTLVHWGSLPLVFGILAFCYSGHAVFPSIRASMRRPEDFPSVLNYAFTIIATLCTFIGAAGYYMYGDGGADVVTFNFRSGWVKSLCACVILVNPIAKFALTMEPFAFSMRKAVTNMMNLSTGYLTRTVINCTLAFGIILVARFLPYLSAVMSLVGAFLTLGISIIFPAAANLKMHHKAMTSAQKAWNTFVVVIGVICALSGTTSAVFQLQAKMVAA